METKTIIAGGVAVVVLTCVLWGAAAPRSASVRRAFLHCLGLRHTPAGCQVDHIRPLHCGGVDALSNLQVLCAPLLAPKEKAEHNCATIDQYNQTHPAGRRCGNG